MKSTIIEVSFIFLVSISITVQSDYGVSEWLLFNAN